VVEIVREDPDLADELRLARISDYLTRQADKMRQQRLLSPILCLLHRQKIYEQRFQNV